MSYAQIVRSPERITVVSVPHKRASALEIRAQLMKHGLSTSGTEPVLRRRWAAYCKYNKMDGKQLAKEVLDRDLLTAAEAHGLRERWIEHGMQNTRPPEPPATSDRAPAGTKKSGQYAMMTSLQLCSELLRRDLDSSGSADEMRQRLLEHDKRVVKSNGDGGFGNNTNKHILNKLELLKERKQQEWVSAAELRRRLAEEDAQNDSKQKQTNKSWVQVLPPPTRSLKHPHKIVFCVSCHNLGYRAGGLPSSFCQIDLQQVLRQETCTHCPYTI